MFLGEIKISLLSHSDSADDDFACAVTKKSKNSKGGDVV